MEGSSFVRKYGPWAVVTGAAMGLGAAFTEILAARGVNVVMVDRAADALARERDLVRARHPHIELREHVIDLADPVQIQALLGDVADVEVGLLVACAAHSGVGAWLDVPLEEKIRQIDVNCAAVTRMVDPLSRLMAERRRGGIIVVSSMAGRQGTPLVATYAATKAFDLVLGESLWAELRAVGVDVLALMPGSTRTPGFEQSLPPGGKLPAAVRVMEADDVVREALDALGRQPSIVAGRSNRLAAGLMTRVLPRRKSIELMGRSMRALYSRKPS
jgi:short-subunit dehydrogenase